MKRWTILVFMAADNDLDSRAVQDLHEMEAIGSTDDVDVVVQVDRYGNGDKGSAFRGKIVKDHDWSRFNVRFVSGLEDIGETNTGDAKTLQDFLEWGVLRFPAERYALIIWNHGSGWKPDFIYERAEEAAGERMAAAMRHVDFASRYGNRLARLVFRQNASEVVTSFVERTLASAASPQFAQAILHGGKVGLEALLQANPPSDEDLEKLIVRAIGLDESSRRDALDCVELKQALRGAATTIASKHGSPFKFDIIGFDACLMAGVEVAFQIRDFADHVVGSEEIEPGKGWQYDLVLRALVGPPISAKELSRRWVGAYTASMQNYKIRLVTQSAIDCSLLPEIASALNALGSRIGEMVDTSYGSLAQSEKVSTRFYDTDFLDVGDFVAVLNRLAPDPSIAKAAEAVAKGVLASEYLFARDRQKPTGLSIYFPTKPVYDDAYKLLDLHGIAPNWAAGIRRYHFLPS